MSSRLYQGASTLTVLIVPHLLRFGQPFWASGRPSDALFLCLGYVAVVWTALAAGDTTRERVAAGTGALAVVGLVLVWATMLPTVDFSRSLAIVTVGLGGLLFLAGQWRSPLARWAVLVLAIASGGAGWWWHAPRESGEARPFENAIFSTHETLEIVNHGSVIAAEDVHLGGGLAHVGNRIVAVSGNGALYLVTWNEARDHIVASRLPVSRPVDLSAFESVITTNPAEAVRVQDLVARATDDGWELFVSHHIWDEQAHCVSVAVSAVVLVEDLSRVVRDWRRVVTTQPCLAADRNDHGEGFQGLLSGGRMEWITPDRLLITIGDHGWDSVARQVAAAQLDDYDYGKVRILEPDSGRLLPFTKGHRNPQGLYIDPNGRIWSTEHGPRGGDELNLLVDGGNYGWPFFTLGSDYASLDWRPALNPPSTIANTGPVHAWLPSVGISALIGIQGDALPRWKGDMVAASLVGKALQRIRLNGDEVQFVESIPVGLRVRDLIESPTGELWLWTDLGEIATLREAGAAAKNANAFVACSSCHEITAGQAGGLGPNLSGVMGRPIASQAEFTAYSKGLSRVGGDWTEERLDAFLRDPATFAPGSTMYFRVPDPEIRASVVAFLRSVR